mmetsp:Transcript_2211/g.5442  ORF Transcript_2211/g.5442 Transcript_2211/m.5442 type:complete len:80 (-) Transcript_2211:88-327(-)
MCRVFWKRIVVAAVVAAVVPNSDLGDAMFVAAAGGVGVEVAGCNLRWRGASNCDRQIGYEELFLWNFIPSSLIYAYLAT